MLPCMWHRTKTNLLYQFEYDENGYDLFLTDLRKVYHDRINSPGMTARGDELNCPFSLETPNQVDKFCRNLALVISKDTEFDLDRKVGLVKACVSEVEWSWVFQLDELSSDVAVNILGGLAGSLGLVVDKIANLLTSRNEVINKKDLIIEGLLESSRRGVEYRAPMFLQEYIKPAKFPNLTSAELVESYWATLVHSDTTK